MILWGTLSHFLLRLVAKRYNIKKKKIRWCHRHESWPTNPAYIQLHPCSSSAKETSKAQRQRDGAVFVLQLPASRSRAEAAAGCRCWQPEKVSWNSRFPRIYILSKCRVSQTIVVKVFFFFRFAGRSSCERRLQRRTWISHTMHLAMRSWSSWCRWIQSPRLGEFVDLQIWRGHLYRYMLLTLSMPDRFQDILWSSWTPWMKSRD